MRPVLCESCAAGKHRAYCPTFPRPCEDLIEIWDDAREATIRECEEIAGKVALKWGVLTSLDATYSRRSALEVATAIRALLTPPSAPAAPTEVEP